MTPSSPRALLQGEELSQATATFAFDGVKLAYPLGAATPPIGLGVAGPRMLELSGEIADATLVSVLAGDAYVRWARERIAAGARRAGRDPAGHRVVVFAFYAAGDDEAAVRAALRPTVAFYLGAGGANALTDAYGISAELEGMIREGGVDAVRERMPDQWVADLSVSGSPQACAQAIDRLLAAGADAVCLFPVPHERAEDLIDLAAGDIVPRLRATA